MGRSTIQYGDACRSEHRALSTNSLVNVHSDGCLGENTRQSLGRRALLSGTWLPRRAVWVFVFGAAAQKQPETCAHMFGLFELTLPYSWSQTDSRSHLTWTTVQAPSHWRHAPSWTAPLDAKATTWTKMREIALELNRAQALPSLILDPIDSAVVQRHRRSSVWRRRTARRTERRAHEGESMGLHCHTVAVLVYPCGPGKKIEKTKFGDFYGPVRRPRCAVTS